MVKIEKEAIQLAKIQLQIELIRRCIAHSKTIILAQAFKQSLRNAKFYASRLPFLLPSESKTDELVKEVDIKLYDLKRYISLRIKALVGVRDVFIEDLFWFSVKDLKSGYVLLYPNYNTKHPNYVLFLVETRDVFDNTLYLPGTIKEFRQVNHTLTSMKGLSEKELGVAFNYASKYEILKELSTLQSIIKSKKDEQYHIKQIK